MEEIQIKYFGLTFKLAQLLTERRDRRVLGEKILLYCELRRELVIRKHEDPEIEPAIKVFDRMIEEIEKKRRKLGDGKVYINSELKNLQEKLNFCHELRHELVIRKHEDPEAKPAIKVCNQKIKEIKQKIRKLEDREAYANKEQFRKIEEIEQQIQELHRTAKAASISIPFEDLAEEYSLSRDEKYIVWLLFYNDLGMLDFYSDGKELLTILGYQWPESLEKCILFQRLIEFGLIEIEDVFYRAESLIKARFKITEKVQRMLPEVPKVRSEKDAVQKESGSLKDERISIGIREESERKLNGLLIVRAPKLTFDQIVLAPEQKAAIERMLNSAKDGQRLLEEWGFNQTIKYGKGMVALFYGPPGTGKTLTSEAIAYQLEKKIAIANYAQLMNKWVGETEKHIVEAFQEAKENDCVLVFDECDGFFGKRFAEEFYSTDRMCTIITNILMQELEQFDGLVILTTNREVVLDEAFNRRILLKLKFDIPKPEERTKIWRMLIPREAPLADDVDFEELGRRFELTGGEIKNVLLNAVLECARCDADRLTMAILIHFAEEELETAQGNRNNQNKIGFGD